MSGSVCVPKPKSMKVCKTPGSHILLMNFRNLSKFYTSATQPFGFIHIWSCMHLMEIERVFAWIFMAMERIAWLNYRTSVFKYVANEIRQAFVMNKWIDSVRRGTKQNNNNKIIVIVFWEFHFIRFEHDRMLRVKSFVCSFIYWGNSNRFWHYRFDSGAQCRFIEHWPWAKQSSLSPSCPLLGSKKCGDIEKFETKSGEKKTRWQHGKYVELNNVLSITIRHTKFQRNPNWKWKRTWTADSNSRAAVM